MDKGKMGTLGKTLGKAISGFVSFVRAWRVEDDPNDRKDPVDVAIAEQVQRVLDAAPREIRGYMADMVHPPYYSGSVENMRALIRQQEAFSKQVQAELDALPADIRHLVEQRVSVPYHAGSAEMVRMLARQFDGSM
jgi:hypothetical protein